MYSTHLPEVNYLTTMADGTVKQINPFTGSQIWTVPGRGNRPLSTGGSDPRPIEPADHLRACAFCVERYLETPPEKSRVVRGAQTWRTISDTTAEQLFETVADRKCSSAVSVPDEASSVPTVAPST